MVSSPLLLVDLHPELNALRGIDLDLENELPLPFPLLL